MTHHIQQEIQELHQNLGRVSQALNQLHQTEHSNAQELQKLHQICTQLDQGLHQISSIAQQPLNQLGGNQFGTMGATHLGTQSWNTQQSGWAQPGTQQFGSMHSQFNAPQYAQQHSTFSQPQSGFMSNQSYVPSQQQGIASSHSYTGPVYAGRMPEGIRERQFKQQEQPQYNMQSSSMQSPSQQTWGLNTTMSQQPWNQQNMSQQSWNQQSSSGNLQGTGDKYGRVDQQRLGQQSNLTGQSWQQHTF